MSGGPGGTAPWPPFDGGRAQLHLVGFMGAGKSTVGRLLARTMVWNFLDLDAVVTRHVGLPVAEIFTRRGEPAFRAAEAYALRQIVQKPRTVVALGGGAWGATTNRETSLRSAMTVWLDCPLEEIRARLGTEVADRPLWDTPVEVARRYAERTEHYAAAHVRVDAMGTPAEVAARVLEAIAGR